MFVYDTVSILLKLGSRAKKLDFRKKKKITSSNQNLDNLIKYIINLLIVI